MTPPQDVSLTESQRRFVAAAVRRKHLFRRLSVIGVAAAVGLSAWWAWRWATGDADAEVGLRFVLVVFILLNARQNLRQYRYAAALEALTRASAAEPPRASSGRVG